MATINTESTVTQRQRKQKPIRGERGLRVPIPAPVAHWACVLTFAALAWAACQK